MKLDGRTLFHVLNGIQDGGIDIQELLKDAESRAISEAEATSEEMQEDNSDALEASESEEENETEE